MTDGPPEPFFHLPDTFAQDDPRLQNGGDPAAAYPQLPAMTVSCGSCERIVGDSSAFTCAVRHAGAIVMEAMVSIKLGEVQVTDSAQGAFDQYCLYKPVNCLKCSHTLGKMYISIAAGVPLSLLNKYTISRTQVLFYSHGSCIPSLPVAESEEILRQLHPEPDEIAVSLEKIMSLLVYLKEEQDGIVRELRRVGSRYGVDDIDVSGSNNAPMGGEGDLSEGWRKRMDKLEGEMERLRGLLGDVVDGGSPAGKAPGRVIPLKAALGTNGQANPAKRKRIEKPAVEPNKRVDKSSSPAFIPAKSSNSSIKSSVVPPAMAKPVIVPPVMKAKGRKVVVEIEESESSEDEGSSDDSQDEEEEASDSEEEYKAEEQDEGDEEEEEEVAHVNAKQKTAKPASGGARWKPREAVHTNNGREREKEKEKEGEEEKERATKTRTSLPLTNGGRASLGARRRTAGGR